MRTRIGGIGALIGRTRRFVGAALLCAVASTCVAPRRAGLSPSPFDPNDPWAEATPRRVRVPADECADPPDPPALEVVSEPPTADGRCLPFETQTVHFARTALLGGRFALDLPPQLAEGFQAFEAELSMRSVPDRTRYIWQEGRSAFVVLLVETHTSRPVDLARAVARIEAQRMPGSRVWPLRMRDGRTAQVVDSGPPPGTSTTPLVLVAYVPTQDDRIVRLDVFAPRDGGVSPSPCRALARRIVQTFEALESTVQETTDVNLGGYRVTIPTDHVVDVYDGPDFTVHRVHGPHALGETPYGFGMYRGSFPDPLGAGHASVVSIAGRPTTVVSSIRCGTFHRAWYVEGEDSHDLAHVFVYARDRAELDRYSRLSATMQSVDPTP